MPGMQGKELAKLANAACRSSKVLFMTSYADHSIGGVGAPDGCLASVSCMIASIVLLGGVGAPDGTDEVIMKPFAPQALEARVRSLLYAV